MDASVIEYWSLRELLAVFEDGWRITGVLADHRPGISVWVLRKGSILARYSAIPKGWVTA